MFQVNIVVADRGVFCSTDIAVAESRAFLKRSDSFTVLTMNGFNGTCV